VLSDLLENIQNDMKYLLSMYLFPLLLKTAESNRIGKAIG